MLPPLTYGILSQGRKTYAEILTQDYGASVVWPLVDISAGTTITAYDNPTFDGLLQGWDLQNAAGPVSGSLAPYSDGVNDFGNLYSASILANFDTSVGGIFLWAKVFDSSIWNPGITVYKIINIEANSSNRIFIDVYNGEIRFYHNFGGTQYAITAVQTTTNFFSVGYTWDTGADEAKAYFNGSNIGTVSSLGTWVGTIDSNRTCIGCQTIIGPGQVWNGWLAYSSLKFGSVWTPTEFLEMHNAALTARGD